MFKYFGILFSKILSKDFWLDRWNTFQSLLKPGEFYGNVGKKDWDINAYLLGLTIGLINMFFFSFMFGGLISLLTSTGGLVAFLLTLIFGLAGWFVGSFVLYYIVAWIFAFAAKLITKRQDIEKIRPILFTITPAGLTGIIPGAGGLITLIVTIVLLVIAYEKALKTERGQAIGTILMGMVFTAIAISIPWILLTTLFVSLISGVGLSALAMAAHVSTAQPQITTKPRLPDSWGIFEFIHSRSDADKQKDAVALITKMITDDIKSTYDFDANTGWDNANNAILLEKLYGAPYAQTVPTDFFRLAVQQVLGQQKFFEDQYGQKSMGVFYFDQAFNALLFKYYAMGKGPATVKVAEIEDRQLKIQQEQQKMQATLNKFNNAFKAMGTQKPQAANPAPGSSESSSAVANTAQPTPTTQKDVAGAVAKKLFGL